MKRTFLFLFMTCSIFSFAQVLSPMVNFKGDFILHEMQKRFKCSSGIEINSENKEIVLNMNTCDPDEIYAPWLKPFVYNLFWYGIDNNEDFTGVKIKDQDIAWSSSQMDFAYIQPEKISIFGRDFILVNDSTYRVERHGNVIVEEFKTKWFDNCVYKTDTLNVVAQVQQWGTRWRINTNCQPFHLQLQSSKMWGDDPNWDYYSLGCIRNGQAKLRTIALNKTNNQFKWNWGLGSTESLTAGYYQIEQDSILILQSDYKLMDDFQTQFHELYPTQSISMKYIIQQKYVIRDDRIYFINEYQ